MLKVVDVRVWSSDTPALTKTAILEFGTKVVCVRELAPRVIYNFPAPDVVMLPLAPTDKKLSTVGHRIWMV